MGYNVKLRVTLAKNGHFDLSFPSAKLKPLGGLKSGKPVKLNADVGPRMDGNGRDILELVIKPYYRKMKGGDLHIFAVEVPNVGN